MLEVGKTNFFQKGKYLIAFLFFVGAPFFYTEATIEPSNVNRLLALPFVLLLMSLGSKTNVLPAPRVLQYMGLVAACILLGLLNAHSSSEVFFELTKFIAASTIVVFALTAWTKEKRAVLWALRFTSTVVIFLCVKELAALENLTRESLYNFRPFYEHHNTIAAALLVLCGLQAYDAKIAEASAKWHAVLNFILLVVLILVLQVRAVYLAMAVAVVVYGLFQIAAKNYKTIIVPAAIVLGILASVFLLKGAGTAGTGVKALTSSNSFNERLQFWSKSVQIIKEHPIIGCGAGNWQFNYAKYSVAGISNLEKGITAQHPHNEVFSIWSETGTLGLVVILLFLLFLFNQFWYEFKKKENDTLALLAAIAIGIGVEAFFSFPKERFLNLFVIALFFALLLQELKLMAELPSSKRIVFRVIQFFVMVVLLLVGGLRLKGEYYTKQMLMYSKQSDPRAALNAGFQSLSPLYTNDPTSSPIAGYLGAAYYALNRPDSMVMQCQRALELAPYDYEALSNLGFALTRFGDQVEARRLLRESLRINPKYEGAWLNIAILDYSQKHYEDAYHEILQIEKVQEKYPEQLGAIQAALPQY